MDRDWQPEEAPQELPGRLLVLAGARHLTRALASGGERNRLLLARLFARPANVLVLDEPTNDLDIDTLELLEDLLQNYDGTVFLVSHDRTFLDNVVTSTIAYEGDAKWREYEGGVSDWLIQTKRANAINAAQGKTTAKPFNYEREQLQKQAASHRPGECLCAGRPRPHQGQKAQLQGPARAGRPARPDCRTGSRAERTSPKPWPTAACMPATTHAPSPCQSAMRRSTKN